MKTEFLIARRYLFARRRKTIVNIISRISLVGIAVGAMALIMVLSVYNGIGTLTQSLFNILDPPLIVEPSSGKTIPLSTIPYEKIQSLDGVESAYPIVEENAWVTHNQNQTIVQLRGVDQEYLHTSHLDSLILFGEPVLRENEVDYALFGCEIAHTLGIQPFGNSPVMIHIPHRSGSLGFSLNDAFNSAATHPSGVFQIQQEIDEKYILTDINLVRSLMEYAPDECTALAVYAAPKHQKALKQQIKELCAPACEVTVKDRYEQQPLYFKIFRSERLAIILILSLIVLISTLSLIASLSLLIIDKQRDINILKSMGMPTASIRRTFTIEGLLIATIGVIVGIALGFVCCFLQQQFGIIKMGDGNFIVHAFPVEMHLSDFLLTFVLVLGISALAVVFTTRHNTTPRTPRPQRTDRRRA